MQLIPLPPNEVSLAVACVVVRRQHGGGMCHFSRDDVRACVRACETSRLNFRTPEYNEFRRKSK